MKHLFLSLSLIFFPVCVLAQDKPKVPEKAPKAQSQKSQIQQLVEELGADDYHVREKAHNALEKIGKPALEALREALKGKDLEVSSRAQELIEKITGRKIQPKSEPKGDVPSKPNPGIPGPGMPEFDPDDMKKMLEKLEDFGGLSPNFKKTLDTFRKLMDGSQNGTPDLNEMGKLFKDLFGKDVPGMPPGPDSAPLPLPQPRSGFAHDFGISTTQVNEVLKAHLRISPRAGNRPAVMLGRGLVVTKVKRGSLAWGSGLRPNDIIIFISDAAPPKVSLPGPYKAWDAWRASGKSVTQADQLNVTKPMHIELIRKGNPCQTLKIMPINKPTPKEDEKDF
jgi:hypothetical protein